MTTGVETWSQRERRYVLDDEQSPRILAALQDRMEVRRFRPDSERTVVSTTYLDTPDRHYFEMARVERGRRSVKVRIRDYVAIVNAEYVPSERCYVERKERVDDVRIKQRFEVDKDSVARLLDRSRAISQESPDAYAIAAEFQALDLEPAMVSVYERQVFGTSRDFRVTFDRNLAYYEPPARLYRDLRVFTRESLGAPDALGPPRILEIKFPARDELPGWLVDLLHDIPRASQFSKYRDGMAKLEAARSRAQR